MKNEYYGKCTSCSHYRINDLRGAERDGYGCDASGKVFGSPYYKRFPFDYSCSRYHQDRNRTDRDIEKAFKDLDRRYGYRPGKSTWWYIATFVNETLGSDIGENYFYTLVDFRENYLQKNLKYTNFLVEYDMYGRLIANSLKNDPKKEEVAQELLLNYIIPICQDINTENYEIAFSKYVAMFEKLKELYQITDVTTYDFANPHQLNDTEFMTLKREKENN